MNSDERRKELMYRAESILRSNAFNNASGEKQTEIVEGMIKKGLVRSDLKIVIENIRRDRKYDTQNINSKDYVSRLEKLPYDL